MHDTLYFTDHHFQVRDMVRDFAQQVVKPSARRYDLASQFPWDNVRQMADLGLFGIPWPEELGGSGMDYLSYIMVIHELAKVGVGHDAALPKCHGVMAAKKEDKLGWRASDTRELVLQDAIVPKENILGPVNNGFRQFLHTLDGGRIGLGALALGIAEGALEECLRYTTTRRQFGKPIASFQGVHFALADMATEIEAAPHLVYHAAWRQQTGQPYQKEAAMAKLH